MSHLWHLWKIKLNKDDFALWALLSRRLISLTLDFDVFFGGVNQVGYGAGSARVSKTTDLDIYIFSKALSELYYTRQILLECDVRWHHVRLRLIENFFIFTWQIQLESCERKQWLRHTGSRWIRGGNKGWDIGLSSQAWGQSLVCHSPLFSGTLVLVFFVLIFTMVKTIFHVESNIHLLVLLVHTLLSSQLSSLVLFASRAP